MAKQELLLRMCYMGYISKKDVMMFLNDGYNHQSETYNGLLDEGLIVEKNIQFNKKQQPLTIVKISDKGKSYVCNKYNTDVLYTADENADKSLNKKTLKNVLSANAVMLLFAKTNTLVYNKPDIKDLEINNYEELLKRGIYYSRKEFLHYLDSQSPSRSDSIIGSRFKGIYVNSDSYYMVYNAEKKQIRLDKPVESRAVIMVKNVFQGISDDPKPKAIVFVTSEAMMYNMAINGHNGHGSHNSESNIHKYVFLNNSCKFFDEICVFPRQSKYLDVFSFFCNIRKDEKLKYQKAILASVPETEFYREPDDLFLAYRKDSIRHLPIVFVSHYDIKLLWKLYKLDYDFMVLVPHEYMAEPIAHAVRRNIKILNLQGSFIETSVYENSGYKVGQVPKPKKHHNRYKTISLRIDMALLKELNRIAEERNLSRSMLIRKILIKNLIENGKEEIWFIK